MTNKSGKVHKFDIWGCCVSRDSFGIPADHGRGISFSSKANLKESEVWPDDSEFRYQICNYIQNCSLAVQLRLQHGTHIVKDDVVHPHIMNYVKSLFCIDYNKEVFKKLEESDSDWIIVDFRSESYGMLQISNVDGTVDYITNYRQNKKIEIFSRFSWVKNIVPIPRTTIIDEGDIDVLVNFVKKKYGKKIILIESRESFYRLTDESKVVDVAPNELSVYIESMYDSLFIKKTGCYFIKCPYNICRDALHKWDDTEGVHYISEYYDYVYDSIRTIVSTPDCEVREKLDVLYADICAKIASIRIQHAYSVDNTLKRAKINLNAGKIDFAIDLYQKLIDQDEPVAYAHMGRLYRDGKYVEMNLHVAAEWMRKAAEKNVGWAKNELFDILWKIGTPEAYAEMISVAKAFAETGDGNAMGRLGRAYCDGKGVEQNLDVAAEWMRKAAEKNVGWAKNELFDILWKIGTPEAYAEMISVAKAFAETGDGNAMGHLGRAYRDGKGVEQNLDVAAEWMRKAADKNVGWAKNELFDILWKIGTPEAYAEMISVAKAFAETGDGNPMGRLGRAYRDGKGVEQNLDVAAEWMRKAAEKNVGWAKNELFDILWRIGTAESYSEMIAVAKAFAETGDGNAMGRLGRAYRDGKGVEQNLDVAAEWMRKAADKNVGWAKNELFDILWRIGTAESYSEMITVAKAFAETGDGNAMGRLGRAYRDGKGVEQNLDVAAEWMRKAADKNVGWAKNELFDILWKIGTPSYLDVIKNYPEGRTFLAKKCYNDSSIDSWKKARKLLNNETSDVCNEVDTVFTINVRVFDSEKIILFGTNEEIKILYAVALQYSLPIDGYITSDNSELSSFFKENYNDVQNNLTASVISLKKENNRFDKNACVTQFYLETGMQDDESKLLLAPLQTKIEKISFVGTKKDVEFIKKEYNLDIICEIHEKPNDLCRAVLNGVTPLLFELNKHGQILISTSKKSIKIRKIVPESIDEIEDRYNLGKIIFEQINSGSKINRVAIYGPMGDQYNVLPPSEKEDSEKYHIIVNDSAKYLPSEIGFSGTVLTNGDKHCLCCYILMTPQKKFEIVGHKFMFPGLTYASDMRSSIQFSENLLPLLIDESKCTVPKGSILINPYGFDIRNYNEKIQNSAKNLFLDISNELIKLGYIVYTNTPFDSQKELPGTVRYSKDIDGFVDDSVNFGCVISTFTGFMEVTMRTSCALIVLSHSHLSRKNYAIRCKHNNYLELDFTVLEKASVISKIIEFIKNPTTGHSPTLCSKKEKPILADYSKEKLKQIEKISKYNVNSIILNSRDKKKLIETCISVNNRLSNAVLAQLYSKSSEMDKLIESTTLYEELLKSDNYKTEWIIADYVNALWNVKTSESCGKIFALSKKLPASKNSIVAGHLGRMYRDGIGVKQDFDVAAEWMRKAADKNVGWAKNELFDILWKIGTPEAYAEMISVAKAFAETGDGNAMGHLGRAYRDGKGVEQNLDVAAEWMRKAADKNVGWAKNELFDILWKIGTPEAYAEMISVAKAFAETGDGNPMGRLGRAYRDGKGVEQNLDVAAEWMRKAAEKNVGWAKNELFDILWRIGTAESYAEMISVAKAFAETGDGNPMGRLGRAYRDGKGVEQNLDVAAEWMRKAAEKNVGWAKNELFDILWRIGTAESYSEMITVAKAFAETGDGNPMGRLGRAYRDGKGVEQNLDVAAEWMRKAAEKNVGWAKNELFDILWRIGTAESYSEMITVAKAFAETGDGNAMGRLGRAYRDGKGVEQNLDVAAEWMRKAADKNVGWAKNELFDILWKIGTPSYLDVIKNYPEGRTFLAKKIL